MSEIIDLAPISVYPGPIEKNVKTQDRRNYIDDLDGADHIDRAVQLRHYENNMQKPENVSSANERQSNIDLVNSAIKNGNYESAEILADTLEFPEEDNNFVEEAATTIGHGIQSAVNNIFVLGEDMSRLTGMGAFVYSDGKLDYLTRQELDDLGDGYEPYKLDLVATPQSVGGNVGSGIISFLVPYLGMLKMARAETGTEKVLSHFTAGGIADYLFDPTHGNLSSVLVDMGVANEFIQALDSRPEEVDQFEKDIKAKFAAREKNVAEGMLIGATISSVMAFVKIASQFPKFTESVKEHIYMYARLSILCWIRSERGYAFAYGLRRV